MHRELFMKLVRYCLALFSFIYSTKAKSEDCDYMLKITDGKTGQQEYIDTAKHLSKKIGDNYKIEIGNIITTVGLPGMGSSRKR